MSDEVQFVLGRMDGKLDALIQSSSETKDRVGKAEQRITSLEQWKWGLMGGASVVGTIASFILNKLFS